MSIKTKTRKPKQRISRPGRAATIRIRRAQDLARLKTMYGITEAYVLGVSLVDPSQVIRVFVRFHPKAGGAISIESYRSLLTQILTQPVSVLEMKPDQDIQRGWVPL